MRNPWISWLLNFLFLWGGYIYNNWTRKVIWYFWLCIACISLIDEILYSVSHTFSYLTWIGGIGISIVLAYDAFEEARILNKQKK